MDDFGAQLKRSAAHMEAVINLIKTQPAKFLNLDKIHRDRLAKRKQKKRRQARERCEDYWQTPWALLLNNPESVIRGTREYKAFRLKFRMPCDLFKSIFIPAVIAHNVFPQQNFGMKQIPVEIKCMIALRILGRGVYACDIEEMSHVKRSTVNTIFKTFIRNVTEKLFAVYVSPPEGTQMAKVMDTYARLGFPGAVGSVDCTHILWNKCPVALSNLCKGKEKYPSLSFEVVVDHDRRIHSCTDGFVGTAPDKVIVVNDEYCRSISHGLYENTEFSLYKADGTFITIRGAYLISDGGYTRLWMFQRPEHNAVDEKSLVWSEFLESVRKDVECTFGILKARFHFLKSFVMYHDPIIITHAMKTCCVIHNMLLAWDTGMKEADWEAMDPDTWDADVQADEPGAVSAAPTNTARAPPPSEIGLGLIPATDGAPVIVGQSNRYRQLQAALQTHFEYAYKRGAVVWPRGFTATQRADFKNHKPSGRRENNVLYKAPSFLRTQPHNSKVGMGLFSSIAYVLGNKIAKFKGDVISRVEYEERAAAGRGGYAVRLTHTTVLDCFEYKDVCFASQANTARGCMTLQRSFAEIPEQQLQDGTPLFRPQNNCEILISFVPAPTVWLVANATIPAHQELFFPYSVSYQLPNLN